MVSELRTQLADALLAKEPTRRSVLVKSKQISQVLELVREQQSADIQL
jgi:hypothetical protein